MKNIKIILILYITIIIQGCVSGLEQNSMRTVNNNVIGNNQPYEYILEKETDKARFYSNTKLRGEVGESITKNSKVLENDIMKGIFGKCNYTIFDLIETRIIPSEIPTFKEIWVFKDEKSEMKDKTTALGITMKQLPNNGGVDIFITGDCPVKIKSIIFGK
ncbi:hypothetical protein [Aliarcobacter lanthieri]|uniref:hypothetical protein n=1 Tax=Aliarcobacter lanthieri TaxID=1355374 RepID=UPI000555D92B|nr:hypothetical protein [Aliarcobacter lanthieri]